MPHHNGCRNKGGECLKATLRTIYALLFGGLLLIEIGIALFVHDAFIRPYVGDVLVTLLLCCLFRVFVPQGVRLLPLYVFLFSAAVEIGQYFDMVKLPGLESHAFLSVLLGRTFSVHDLLCYAIGCLLFVAIDHILYRHRHCS